MFLIVISIGRYKLLRVILSGLQATAEPTL